MKINLNTVFKLLATMLVVSLLILFCSCNARKTEKSNSEKEVSSLESLNIINSDWSKAFENYFSKDNTITVVREKFINGNISEKETVTKNNKTESRQKTNETLIYKTYAIYKTYRITEVTKTKNTDKKQFNPLWIVVAIGAIYILWDKFKHKIWWV